jgi:hypothetical protein
MTRTGQKIPNKDFDEISAPARRYLTENRCNRVILIDDLERSDQWEPRQIFERYRSVLDAGLPEELKGRASVHFFVPMLEAYFFAHPDALNSALNLTSPIEEHDDDVESIGNPKSKLKRLFPSYNEISTVEEILQELDLDIVLSNAKHCASLRTCVKWIVDQLSVYPDQEVFAAFNFDVRFHLLDGELYSVTSGQ